MEELNAAVLESKLTIEGLEKERDFYFGKLRDIEVLCQEQEGTDFAQRVLNVLYQTEVWTSLSSSIRPRFLLVNPSFFLDMTKWSSQLKTKSIILFIFSLIVLSKFVKLCYCETILITHSKKSTKFPKSFNCTFPLSHKLENWDFFIQWPLPLLSVG